jgi:hypothetical protein
MVFLPKKAKKIIDASDNSVATVPTSNVSKVQVNEVFEAVLPFDEVRENTEADLPLDNANVNSNVLKVWEDSEDTLRLDNPNVTENVREEANVQEDKGSDAFIEYEQNGVEVEDELSELIPSRMKTTVTEKKVHFKIIPHKNKKKAKRTQFFGRKPVSKKTSSVTFIKATDKKNGSIQEIRCLREVIRPKIEEKTGFSETNSEKKDLSHGSIAVKGEKKGMSNSSIAVSDRISSVCFVWFLA